MTSPFVDEMYERLNGTLDEYDIIIRRWPEYAISLEKVSETEKTSFKSNHMLCCCFMDRNSSAVVVPWKKVVADAEKAIVEAMEKQFTEILSPLKESKIFGLKIVKKFTKGTPNPYSVPNEVCCLL